MITSISGFPNLCCKSLTAVNFCGVTSIGGFLSRWNNQLTSITFGSLTSIGGYLNLSGNLLTNITFGSLTSIGGDLYLEYNQLTSITFPANLTSLAITSSIIVCNNPGAASLLASCQARYGTSKCDPRTSC